MARTDAPAIKAALLTALLARPALAQVKVDWGLPAEVPQEYERLYIRNDANHDLIQRGGTFVLASYSIGLSVEVYADTDQRATEERLWVLIEEIDAVTGSLPAVDADLIPGDTELFAYESGWLARQQPNIRVRTLG